MRSVVIIPARFGSSRYPGKPLVPLLGKPMILWVAELSARAVGKSHVYVATEDARIFDVVESAGFQAVMTTDDALTGTDRLAQAAEQISADIYINVQGDEPLVDPEDIQRVAALKRQRMDKIVNAFTWMASAEDPHSRNIPKVVATEDGRMLYMSRAALPSFKDPACAPERYRKQVCIYAFTRDELRAYAAFGRKSAVEVCEDIEILRFCDMGFEIDLVETRPGSLAVDAPDDIAPVEAALKALHSL